MNSEDNMTKLYRIYSNGLIEPEAHIDVCIGQIYTPPIRCDICGTCGVNVLEIDYMSTDVCFCPSCLRALADAVEAVRADAIGDA